MAIFNENYIMEMKSKEEYARRSFKKKYNFKEDKPGSNTGTITVDGKTHKVDMKKSSTAKIGDQEVPRQTANVMTGNDRKILLDKNYFKLKGSHNNERRDAILQHEIGHGRLHGVDSDKDKKSTKVFKDTITKNTKDQSGLDISKIKKCYGVSGHNLRKTIYDNNGAKDYVKDMDKSKIKDREAAYSKAKKYEKSAAHANASEFEADRYAANRTSERAVKKGVNNAYRLAKQDKSIKSANGLKNKDDIKNVRKYINNTQATDMKQRSKALKDKDLRDEKIYKK